MGEETRVLCVGGTDELREVISTAPGLELTSVGSVAGATDRLSREPYDVVITVESLPDGSGLGLAEKFERAIPVVFCPREGNESLAGRALAAGVDGYVPAEEVETHLLERVRTIVAESRGGRDDRKVDPRLTLSALESTHGPDPMDWFVHDEADWSTTGSVPGESATGVGPNQRLSALVEQSPLAIVEWTTELAVATWNPAAESLFGYSAAAARGRRPTELIVPEDQREALRNAIKALLTGAETVTTAVIETVTATGERRSCEWYNTPLFAGDGSVAGVLSFARDVSTEVRPVETLEALYETTRTLFRASSRGAVAERIVDVARELLGGATVDIRLHDVDRNALVNTGTAAPEPLPLPPIEPGSTLWRPYETGEAMTVKRVDALDAEWIGEADVESLACYPLDHHGILIFGLPSQEILGPELHRVGNVLATTATAALDRAERERSLRRSQTIVEAIGDGVYATDRNGNILAVNDTLVSMTGYARTRLERGHLSLVLEDEAIERSQHLVQELVDTDVGATTAAAEFDLETADGELIPCKATLSPLIEDGEFVGTVGILRDVSEHKHMQAELDAQRQKIDAIHDAVTRLEDCEDVQTALDTAIDAAEHLLQFDVCSIAEYDEDDERLRVRSMSTEAVVFDRDEVRTLDSGVDARAFETGERQIAADLETSPGTEPIDGRFRSALAVPIGEYGVFRAVATPPDAFDETDARLAELLVSHVSNVLAQLELESRSEAGSRSESDPEPDSDSEPAGDRDRFAGLFDSVPHPVVVLRGDDGRAIVTDANPAFERVSGHDRETIVDEPLAAQLAAVDDETLLEADVERWTDGTPIETEVRRRTGTGTREFELTIHPIDTAGDSPTALALYSDVTDQSRRERRVGVLDRVLRHDLRTNRNVLRVSAEVLREAIEVDQSRSDTGTIAERADELLAIAETTGAIERTLDRDGPEIGAVDAVTAVEDAIDRLAESHPEAATERTGPDTAMVRADGLLRSAIYHLVHNGIVHNPDDDPEVTVSIDTDDEHVRIRVADDGPGIDTREYAWLAESTENTLPDEADGLGLWIVDRAVTRAGGSLSFDENDPQGTVVTVELPVAAEDIEPPEYS